MPSFSTLNTSRKYFVQISNTKKHAFNADPLGTSKLYIYI